MLSSDKISGLITEANGNSSSEALKLHESGFVINKFIPLTKSFSKLLTTFIKNEKKLAFKNRLVSACISSFTELIKYLKLLKLNKDF